MTVDMKRLLAEILAKDLSSSQVLDVCHVVRDYRDAVREFHQSFTPESEALARWRMNDCRSECYRVFNEYGLCIPALSELI